jgi:hypothetical protein
MGRGEGRKSGTWSSPRESACGGPGGSLLALASPRLASPSRLVSSLDSTTTIASCNSSLPRPTPLTSASRTPAPAPLCGSKNGALPAVLAPFTAPALYFFPLPPFPFAHGEDHTTRKDFPLPSILVVRRDWNESERHRVQQIC